MKSLFTLIFILSSLLIQGQVQIERQVIGSGGKHVKIADLQISFNIGEPQVKTIKGNNITLTQGFEQGEMRVLGIEPLEGEMKVSAFPNPSRGNLKLELEAAIPGSYRIEVFDVNGKRVLDPEELMITRKVSTSLDLRPLAAGTYIIRIESDRARVRRNIKVEIIK